MQYTETQLSKLIEDVEKEFTAHLAKAEEDSLEVLSKGEKPEEKAKEEPKAEPEAEAKPEESAPEESAPEGEAPQGIEPKGEEVPAMQPQGQPQDHDYDDEDLQHLEKMYGSMSKGELMVHHDAVKAALDKCMGAGMGKSESGMAPQPKVKGENLDSDPADGGIEGSEPHNTPGAKSPASDANGAKINKSEFARRNGGKIDGQTPSGSPGAKSPASKEQGNLTNMEKSEQNTEVELLKTELADAKAKFDDLKKNYDGVGEFLGKLLEARSAPTGKAITSLDAITKSEDTEDKSLNKSEIHNILCKKSSDPTLQKSDREAINVYYAEGQVDIKGINHLLK